MLLINVCSVSLVAYIYIYKEFYHLNILAAICLPLKHMSSSETRAIFYVKIKRTL